MVTIKGADEFSQSNSAIGWPAIVLYEHIGVLEQHMCSHAVGMCNLLCGSHS